jgi:nitrogenase subunit NifH
LVKFISKSQITDETEIKWNKILKGIPSHKTYNRWRSLCKKFIRKNFSENGIPLPFDKAVQIIMEKLTNGQNK